MTTIVWVTTEFIGFHKVENAPESHKYLSYPHRHLFKVRVDVEVTDKDRQVEFHKLQQTVSTLLDRPLFNVPDETAYELITLKQPVNEVSTLSCEMIADKIFKLLTDKQFLVSQVSVSEDGECGALLRR